MTVEDAVRCAIRYARERLEFGPCLAIPSAADAHGRSAPCIRFSFLERSTRAGAAYLGGWECRGVTAVVATDVVTSHEQCVKLTETVDEDEPGTAYFGVGLDALPFRGRTVAYRASARVSPAREDGSARLYLCVMRAGGDGPPEDVLESPIAGTDWRAYEIVQRVDDDATHVRLRVELAAVGEAWLQDVSFGVIADGEGPSGA